MDQPSVGDLITRDNTHGAPVGTVAENQGAMRAVREYTGWLVSENRFTTPEYLPTHFARDLRVTLMGEPIPDSFLRFSQRLRTVSVGRAYANGVSVDAVRGIMSRANVPECLPTVGMFVDFSDAETNRGIPVGSIAQVGSPNIWDLYGLYRFDGSSWVWFTGGHSGAEGGTVIQMTGEVHSWATDDPEEGDDERIEELKRQILTIGAEVKRTQGWCPQYEAALDRLCILAPKPGEATTPTAGPVVNTDGWTEAPRGRFVVGDRVTRRNRPHTVRGTGNYHEAELGVVGTITEERYRDSATHVEGAWRVNWDGGRYSIIDGNCLMLAEQEFEVGTRVCRAYGQRLSYGGNDEIFDHQTPAGGVGVVNDINDDNTVTVDWDNGHNCVEYDTSCLEIIRPAEGVTPELRAPVVGDRVRLVRRFAYRGRTQDTWDTRFGVIGDIGIVTYVGDDVINATWPNGSDPTFNANLDRSCVEVVLDEHTEQTGEVAEDRPVEEGDRVRLIYPYSYLNRHDPTWVARFGDVGAEGVVHAAASGGRTVSVRWEGGTDRGPASVDRTCIERVVPERASFAVGDRVRRVGNYWVTSPQDDNYNHIADVGHVGEVREVVTFRGHDCLMVAWDNRTGTSRINVACVEHENLPQPGEPDRPLEEGDRVRVRPGGHLTYDGRVVDGQLGDDLHTREGTVGRRSTEGIHLIHWEGGPDLVYDLACLERVPSSTEPQPEAEREWQVGDRVELISEYTNRGTPRPGIASVGDHGTVYSIYPVYLRNGMVEVNWDTNNWSGRFADVSTLRYLPPDSPEPAAEEPANDRPLEVGDRVRRREGNYSISDMRYNPAWERYCSPGDTGEVTETLQRDRLGAVRVRWHNESTDTTARTRGRRIDVACLERVDSTQPEPEDRREFERGDSVRLARPYTIEGRTEHRTSGRSFVDIYPTGMVGTIQRGESERGELRDGTVGVRWENFTPQGNDGFVTSRVDAACLDLVDVDLGTDPTPEPEGETTQAIVPGHRVRLARTYTISGTVRSDIAPVDSTGSVIFPRPRPEGRPETIDRSQQVVVRWDHMVADPMRNRKWVDVACLEVIETEPRPTAGTGW